MARGTLLGAQSEAAGAGAGTAIIDIFDRTSGPTTYFGTTDPFGVGTGGTAVPGWLTPTRGAPDWSFKMFGGATLGTVQVGLQTTGTAGTMTFATSPFSDVEAESWLPLPELNYDEFRLTFVMDIAFGLPPSAGSSTDSFAVTVALYARGDVNTPVITPVVSVGFAETTGPGGTGYRWAASEQDSGPPAPDIIDIDVADAPPPRLLVFVAIDRSVSRGTTRITLTGDVNTSGERPVLSGAAGTPQLVVAGSQVVNVGSMLSIIKISDILLWLPE